MMRKALFPLVPAGAAWTSLLSMAEGVGQGGGGADAAAALALVRELPTGSRASRPLRRWRVDPGAATELLAGGRSGGPLLGVSLPREPPPRGTTVYEVLASGRWDGRPIRRVARLWVSRRPTQPGDWLVVADRSALRLERAGPRGLPEGYGDLRVLGAVDGIVSERDTDGARI
jgi:hypothetical protein